MFDAIGKAPVAATEPLSAVAGMTLYVPSGKNVMPLIPTHAVIAELIAAVESLLKDGSAPNEVTSQIGPLSVRMPFPVCAVVPRGVALPVSAEIAESVRPENSVAARSTFFLQFEANLNHPWLAGWINLVIVTCGHCGHIYRFLHTTEGFR